MERRHPLRSPRRLRACSKRSSPRPTQGRFRCRRRRSRRADSSRHAQAHRARRGVSPSTTPGRAATGGRLRARLGSRRERRRQQRVGPPPTRGCAQHVPRWVSSNNRDSPGRGVQYRRLLGPDIVIFHRCGSWPPTDLAWPLAARSRWPQSVIGDPPNRGVAHGPVDGPLARCPESSRRCTWVSGSRRRCRRSLKRRISGRLQRCQRHACSGAVEAARWSSFGRDDRCAMR
jgi:hypothetical protein